MMPLDAYFKLNYKLRYFHFSMNGRFEDCKDCIDLCERGFIPGSNNISFTQPNLKQERENKVSAKEERVGKFAIIRKDTGIRVSRKMVYCECLELARKIDLEDQVFDIIKWTPKHSAKKKRMRSKRMRNKK